VDAFHHPPSGDEATEIDRYDGELARTNAVLRAWLERYRDLAGAPLERTLVVVAGTNGVRLGASDDGVDSPLVDGMLHVPLVLRHPQSLTGSRILSEVIELADVLPTLCDWLEIPLPAGARGRSLLPLVDSHVERAFERRPACAATYGWLSARDARWRMIDLDGRGEGHADSGPVWLEVGAPPSRSRVDEARVDTAPSLRAGLHRWLAHGASNDS
jgi:arylsulfatase A-like enzyme